MNSWQCGLGKTLLVDSGPSGKHLHIIVWGPSAAGPSYGSRPIVVLVGVTSIRPGLPHDSTCTLACGDHPFIRHPSFVAYRFMRYLAAIDVHQNVASGLWTPHVDCSQALAQRIVEGVKISGSVPRHFRDIIE